MDTLNTKVGDQHKTDDKIKCMLFPRQEKMQFSIIEAWGTARNVVAYNRK